jgi:AcrR family transcriptional regulator
MPSGVPPNPNDPRFRRSYEALVNAVTVLLEYGSLPDLSIAQIVEYAGVTRPTFYQHFPDIQTAAQHAALAKLDEIFNLADEQSKQSDVPTGYDIENFRQDTILILRHLREHENFYLTILNHAGTSYFFDELIRFVSERLLPTLDKEERKGWQQREQDCLLMASGGATWMAVRWLCHGSAREQTEVMAERITQTANTLISAAGLWPTQR